MNILENIHPGVPAFGPSDDDLEQWPEITSPAQLKAVTKVWLEAIKRDFAKEPYLLSLLKKRQSQASGGRTFETPLWTYHREPGGRHHVAGEGVANLAERIADGETIGPCPACPRPEPK